jgi:ABC-2 type transport system ATP-binding protein
MGEAGRLDVVLEVQGLVKRYGDLVAVDGLSLEVWRGEVFGLLGPNGAGKTTTINIVCGLLDCDEGEVVIDGHSSSDPSGSWRPRLGLCPQDLVIWESLTCLEQLEFVGQLYDVPWRLARHRGLEVLDVLGLGDRRNRLAKTLSGGMQRRLNLALALVHDPDILILDEPQAGLDPQSRILVREYIRSLARNKTVVLTTHDMDEADRLADRIAIIDHGRLLVLDTPQTLKDNLGAGDVVEVRVTEGQDSKLEKLDKLLTDVMRNVSHRGGVLRIVGVEAAGMLPDMLETLRTNGVQLQDVILRKKTLEDVFIALTGRGLRE